MKFYITRGNTEFYLGEGENISTKKMLGVLPPPPIKKEKTYLVSLPTP